MTPELIKKTIKEQTPFVDQSYGLRGKIPMQGETAISAGILRGPARSLFMSEVEFSTLRYIVISEGTPILWRGAWEWIMPPRVWAKTISHIHYLLMLEVMEELNSEQ